MKPVIISGIQPTGPLHLGNYLGALKNFTALQNSGKYNCCFFAADYHSLTEDFDPKTKSRQIFNLIVDCLAAGLNPKQSTIFIQSAIPAIPALAWILNTLTPLGELKRMTQFKEKSENALQNINAGLFNYPVLMAADVLIFNTRFVPIGEDQLQHLEFARTLARRFNKRFGQILTEPRPLLTIVPRLMALNNPHKKMSKSQPKGCLFLDDSPTIIKEKIQKAVTDSGSEIKYELVQRPAISNLIMIYSALTDLPIPAIEKKFQNQNYAKFKKELADATIKGLTPFQKKKKEWLNKINEVKKIISSGNRQAALAAEKNIIKIKQKIGLEI